MLKIGGPLLEVVLLVGPVDTKGTAVEVGAVQAVDGLLGGVLVGELAEAEALRTPSLAVVHQSNVDDRARLREEVAQLIFGGLVWDVSNIDGVARSTGCCHASAGCRRRKGDEKTGKRRKMMKEIRINMIKNVIKK